MKASSDIVNIQNKDNQTALDLIGKNEVYADSKTLCHAKELLEMGYVEEAWKLIMHDELNNEIERNRVAKLLCEHGGIFNKPEEVIGILKLWIEPTKLIGRILDQKAPEE